MDISVYENRKCLICDGEFIKYEDDSDLICVNECCILFVSDFEDMIQGVQILFEKEHGVYAFPYWEKEALERIKYWREDYRYLAELLERG